MYTIEMEKECGCFKKSKFKNPMTFDDKDEALLRAGLMVTDMNREFCKKHRFKAVEVDDNTIRIQVSLRGEVLQEGGGCCGGGHCS